MKRFVVPCLLGLCVALVGACSASNSDGDDDDDSNESGGTGGTGGTGGSAGSGGAGGSGGSAGTTSKPMGAEKVLPGPYPFPQNKKPPYCALTTVAGASTAVSSAYTSWKTAYLVSAGTGLRVQRPENANDTVSEGIAYGMLMAVYLNDKVTFDGLWTYSKSHSTGSGLMNWRIDSAGNVTSDGMGSATDADEDMAWALLMAYGQWGINTYFDDAKKVANAIMTYSVRSDSMLLPGNTWGNADRTYPDYFSPSYFRVFKEVFGDTRWDAVIAKNYQILAGVTGQYGLVPDYTTSTLDMTQAYKYDACRTPWRIGMDYCFYGVPEAKAYLDKIGAFFNTQGVANIGDGYSLTGQKTSSFGNMAFVGPAGVAGMAGFPKLLDDAFTYGVNATDNANSRYYQHSLRVVTMLMMSGNFVDFTKP